MHDYLFPPCVYNIRCIRSTKTLQVGLNPTNCEEAAENVCIRLSYPVPQWLPRGRSLWMEEHAWTFAYHMPKDYGGTDAINRISRRRDLNGDH